MGDTKKAIKNEIKAIYKNVLAELDEEQKKLTSDEKIELKNYIEGLSEGTSHSFSHIFIKRKIRDIINRRTGSFSTITGCIENLTDDEPEIKELELKGKINNIKKWHELIKEKTQGYDENSNETFIYRQGIVFGLFLAKKINEDEKFCLLNSFDENYIIETNN